MTVQDTILDPATLQAHTAFGRLTLVERQLLWMRYADRLPVDHIAELLQVSPHRTTLLMERLLSRFRQFVETPAAGQDAW